MVGSTRTLIPLFIIFLLLTTCGSADIGVGNNTSSAFTLHALTNLRQRLSPAAVSSCQGLTASCVTPQTMRAAYGIDSLLQKGFTGKGQTVVDLIYLGSPTLQQDMDVFDRTFNLPPVDLQVLSPLTIPAKASRQDREGAAQETQLDVEAIHALAPGAKIVVVQSPVVETQGIVGLPEFLKLEQYIITQKLGSIVSQSWGASELTLKDAQSQRELQQWNALLQQGTITDHITYFFSSGDSGAADAIDAKNDLGSVPTTSFGADSPWVTSVGGTRLRHVGPTFPETAWSDSGDGSGSGGGFSSFFQTPFYQKVLPVLTQKQFINRRGVPDVSAVGDPATGLPVYVSGQWNLVGGTSLSAPIWAAVGAIANQVAGHPLGFINPGLYKLGASATYQRDFHDITKGSNSNLLARVKGYSAVPGWDAVTGLGTPNAVNLIPDLIGALK
ncbi:MAG TPA: S53 family peptidase [Ktedonobacteraceae bacterium]